MFSGREYKKTKYTLDTYYTQHRELVGKSTIDIDEYTSPRYNECAKHHNGFYNSSYFSLCDAERENKTYMICKRDWDIDEGQQKYYTSTKYPYRPYTRYTKPY